MGARGTADGYRAGFLRNEEVLPWVTRTRPDDDRPQFDPAAFVRSRHTIYLVSREGRGTARALTAALTVAIVTAAERLAAACPAGRLPVPLTCVLDEAANVCRWPDLPDLYSHYGSRGIVIATYLQGWSQGVQAWGREGMEKLWTAANVRMVGAGIAETDFLERVSKLVGDHDVVSRSTSSTRAGAPSPRSCAANASSTSRTWPRSPAAAPCCSPPASPAALVKLTHWTETPYADRVRASEAYYGAPAAPATEREPVVS